MPQIWLADGAVPVHLDVDVVARRFGELGALVVVLGAVVGARHVGQRVVRLHLLRDRVDAVGRDLRASELAAAGAGGRVARRRVVEAERSG